MRLTPAAGRSVSVRAACIAAAMAVLDRNDSEPPRSTTALPLLRHSDPQSLVTFGRDS